MIRTVLHRGKLYKSEPLKPRFWDWIVAQALADPNPRGLARVLLYAFPLRRLRNWRLWGATSEERLLLREQLLGPNPRE